MPRNAREGLMNFQSANGAFVSSTGVPSPRRPLKSSSNGSRLSATRTTVVLENPSIARSLTDAPGQVVSGNSPRT